MKNPLTEYGLFGWNLWHLMTHPWVLVKEIYYYIKWFIQRGHRGYADCDVWSIDGYLAKWMPEALESLKKEAHAYPIGMTAKGWTRRLETMKQGFLAARRIQDLIPIEEYKQQKRIMDKGLKEFTIHFLSLWD